MGFEVPAAIGAQVAAPNDTVWSICGDGGFQMTLAGAGDDRRVRAADQVRDHQQRLPRAWSASGRSCSTRTTSSPRRCKNPDFVKLAEAYGIRGLRAEKKLDVKPAIETALSHPGPVLIDFQVELDENSYPMVPPGASLDETIDQPAYAFEPKRVADKVGAR